MKFETFKPMLAKTDIPRSFNPVEWAAQVKYDGTRCIAFKQNGKVTLHTRSDKSELTESYPEIVNELENVFPYDNIILDGEIVFFPEGCKYGKFVTALATDETKEEYTIKYLVFDILKHDKLDFTTWNFLSRNQYLNNLFMRDTFDFIKKVDTYSAIGYEDIFRAVVSDGGEGIVLKKYSDVYEFNKRKWIKIKQRDTADVYIIGMTRGTGKRSNLFGALVMGTVDEDGKVTCVGKCSGFTDAEMYELFNRLRVMEDYEYFDVKLPRGTVKSVAPEIMIEIEYMEITPDGYFRHPRFVRIRDDKA